MYSFAFQVKSRPPPHNHFPQKKKKTLRLVLLSEDAIFISIEVGSFKSLEKEIACSLNTVCFH